MRPVRGRIQKVVSVNGAVAERLRVGKAMKLLSFLGSAAISVFSLNAAALGVQHGEVSCVEYD